MRSGPMVMSIGAFWVSTTAARRQRDHVLHGDDAVRARRGPVTGGDIAEVRARLA